MKTVRAVFENEAWSVGVPAGGEEEEQCLKIKA